jgi:hypothetical protein
MTLLPPPQALNHLLSFLTWITRPHRLPGIRKYNSNFQRIPPYYYTFTHNLFPQPQLSQSSQICLIVDLLRSLLQSRQSRHNLNTDSPRQQCPMPKLADHAPILRAKRTEPSRHIRPEAKVEDGIFQVPRRRFGAGLAGDLQGGGQRSASSEDCDTITPTIELVICWKVNFKDFEWLKWLEIQTSAKGHRTACVYPVVLVPSDSYYLRLKHVPLIA